MLFNSKLFPIFLLTVLSVYYWLGKEAKLWFLLGMSYVFYGFWNPWLCGLIFLSTLVDYAAGIKIDAAGDNKALRKRWLGVSLAMNLGALGFFKYYNFFLDSLEFNLALVGLPSDLSHGHLDLILPVGISFYTFQTLSYTIEVYRGNFKADRNFRDFALFVAFFPQLVAGPVERATHLLPQYKLPFTLTKRQVYEGVFLILLGLVKKVVIGDRLANMIDPYFANEVGNGAIAWMSVVLFTTDIYVDFSAYSDIAIGLGRLLGYDIRPNFNLPFVVPSIPERWRRWHMSMGHWFRDYIYFPLGGNRHGVVRTQINILTVMFLSGLWHGASYNFVVWGLLNGLTMVGHRVIRDPILRPLSTFARRHWALERAYFYLCCWNTLLMISAINIFFRSDTWPVAKSFVYQMFGRNPWHVVEWFSVRQNYPEGYLWGFQWMFVVFCFHEAERYWGIKDRIVDNRVAWTLCCLGMYLLVLIFGIKGPAFIYYQF